jgi:hypothetical protein
MSMGIAKPTPALLPLAADGHHVLDRIRAIARVGFAPAARRVRAAFRIARLLAKAQHVQHHDRLVVGEPDQGFEHRALGMNVLGHRGALYGVSGSTTIP